MKSTCIYFLYNNTLKTQSNRNVNKLSYHVSMWPNQVETKPSQFRNVTKS